MKLIVFVLLQAVLINVGGAHAQIANTTYGAVQGTTLLSRNGRGIAAFLGMPYAKSMHGGMRFKVSQPPEKWEGVRDATSYGYVCPQYTGSGANYTGDEDCLTINVFTNNLANATTKQDLHPVLVFIHGGYFMALSGNQGPMYLLDHDVVFVTFNYRLGALGFLGIPDGNEDNAPGNAAMKDQVLALKWVQENIHNFGGDANRVTIYGESAGGAAVHYHLLSPMSEGLFSAAISGSGTAFKLNSYQYSNIEAAEKTASEVGCGEYTGNHTEMIACLRSVSASEFGLIGDEFTKPLKDPLRLFSPSIEANNSNPYSTFITQHPYEMLTDGLQKTVPWMVGVNSGEGFLTTMGIYESDEWTNEINNNWNNGLAPKFLIYNESDIELTNSINAFYLNASMANGSIDFRNDFLGFSDIFTDRLYIHASMEAARIQGNLSPVYLYYNDYITTANPIGLGVIHGEELALIFSPANFTDPIIDQGHPDYKQSKAMVDLWVQFINDPHNVTYNDRLWTPVESFEENPSCLVFKNSNRGEQGVATLPAEIMIRVNFWESHGVPPYQDYAL